MLTVTSLLLDCGFLYIYKKYGKREIAQDTNLGSYYLVLYLKLKTGFFKPDVNYSGVVSFIVWCCIWIENMIPPRRILGSWMWNTLELHRLLICISLGFYRLSFRTPSGLETWFLEGGFCGTVVMNCFWIASLIYFHYSWIPSFIRMI